MRLSLALLLACLALCSCAGQSSSAPDHPVPPLSDDVLTVPEDAVLDLLDPGAAFPRRNFSHTFIDTTRTTMSIVAPTTPRPGPTNVPVGATRLAWAETAEKGRVCDIPSSRANVTRLSALRSLSSSIVDALDVAVNPCDNFYQFACGGWTARWNESMIPPEYSSWSKSFAEIDKRNERIMREVLECSRLRLGEALHRLPQPPAGGVRHANDSSDDDAWVDATPDSTPPRIDLFNALDPIDRQLGAFYAACMDQTRIDSRGLAPIQPLLDRLARIHNLHELMRVTGDLAYEGSLSFFYNMGIGVSPRDATRYVVNLAQGGIPFATRDLLVGSANVTQAYTRHVENMFRLAGESADLASEKAKRVVGFQMRIAELHWPVEELRVPEKMDNPMTISALSSQTDLDWLVYLRHALNNQTLSPDLIINVAQPTHFQRLARLLHTTPLQTLRDVGTWVVLHAFAGDLPRPFGRETFAFFGHALAGTPRQSRRHRVCQSKATGLMADAMSTRFVNVAFTPRTEELARDMMQHVQLAFLKRLPDLRWMDPQDKLKAADKLGGMLLLVGSTDPALMLNYSSVPLSPTRHFENQLHLLRFLADDIIGRMWAPVDRRRFQMPAMQVNAYYDRQQTPTARLERDERELHDRASLNSMNFPSGIIQPTFFSEHYPPQWNYASLGSVMGHELTHGFDDEGRKFDRTGALKPWWTNATTVAFANSTSCLVRQYSEYRLANLTRGPTPRIRGLLTLGENLADQGGIALSHEALQLKMREERARQSVPSLAKPIADDGAILGLEPGDVPSHVDFLAMQEMSPMLRRFNEKQLFFIGYAQTWCRSVRPESFTRTLLSDPHSPSEARVNVPLGNFPPFRRAFQCKRKEDQYAGCTLW